MSLQDTINTSAGIIFAVCNWLLKWAWLFVLLGAAYVVIKKLYEWRMGKKDKEKGPWE